MLACAVSSDRIRKEKAAWLAPTWALSEDVFRSLSEDGHGAVGGDKQVTTELGSLGWEVAVQAALDALLLQEGPFRNSQMLPE